MAQLKGKARKRLEKALERPLPKDEKKMFNWLRRTIVAVVKLFTNIVWPVEYVGQENIPADGSGIISGNHGSKLDILFVMFAVTDLDRWVYWVARESLFKNRFINWLFTYCGVTPIDTNSVESYSIKNIFKHLKDGHLVGIFPQGTRCRTQEKLENTPPKTGAVSFAVRTNTPIIPVAIESDFKAFKKSRVIFGEPYYIETDKKHLTEPEMMAYSIELLEKVFGMMGQEYPLKNKYELTNGLIED